MRTRSQFLLDAQQLQIGAVVIKQRVMPPQPDPLSLIKATALQTTTGDRSLVLPHRGMSVNNAVIAPQPPNRNYTDMMRVDSNTADANRNLNTKKWAGNATGEPTPNQRPAPRIINNAQHTTSNISNNNINNYNHVDSNNNNQRVKRLDTNARTHIKDDTEHQIRSSGSMMTQHASATNNSGHFMPSSSYGGIQSQQGLSGYSAYSPYGYGGGYGSPFMMGGYGMMAGGGGPMSFIYSINYSIAMMGQVMAMLGMSSQAITHLYHMATEACVSAERAIRQSSIRRWFQQKSRKSPLFRWLCVLSTMLAASQVVRLLKFLIEAQIHKCRAAKGALPLSNVQDNVLSSMLS